jgi:hypothetical protein
MIHARYCSQSLESLVRMSFACTCGSFACPLRARTEIRELTKIVLDLICEPARRVMQSSLGVRVMRTVACLAHECRHRRGREREGASMRIAYLVLAMRSLIDATSCRLRNSLRRAICPAKQDGVKGSVPPAWAAQEPPRSTHSHLRCGASGRHCRGAYHCLLLTAGLQKCLPPRRP